MDIELSVRSEVEATRFPCYTKRLQLDWRLMSEVVGVLCEIHITLCVGMTLLF
jgi:hypothetical protein